MICIGNEAPVIYTLISASWYTNICTYTIEEMEILNAQYGTINSATNICEKCCKKNIIWKIIVGGKKRSSGNIIVQRNQIWRGLWEPLINLGKLTTWLQITLDKERNTVMHFDGTIRNTQYTLQGLKLTVIIPEGSPGCHRE